MKNSPPQHVAIIMDGNGRWAKTRNLPTMSGHKKGAEVAFEIVREAQSLGVEWLTLYTFSTENWKRPESWVTDLLGLLRWYLEHKIQELKKQNARLHVIGDLTKFSSDIQNGFKKAFEDTKDCTGINVVLAVNYGSHDEIIKCTQSIARQVLEGTLNIENINDETIRQSLYTKGMPDPDLLIRTAGEQRISNYLLWQLAYTELHFSKKFWPDYTKEDFKNAILDYQGRERRFGEYTNG